jgi:hypothetical protein
VERPRPCARGVELVDRTTSGGIMGETVLSPEEEERRRIGGQREYERKRQAERGRTDPTRGRTDPTRGRTDPTRGRTDPTRGRTDPTRGRTDPTRGRTDPTRGIGLGSSGPGGTAADIFQGAVSLGGHLIVAFVAPVSASCDGAASRTSSRAEKLAADAEAEWVAILESIRRRKSPPVPAPGPEKPHSDSPVQTTLPAVTRSQGE